MPYFLEVLMHDDPTPHELAVRARTAVCFPVEATLSVDGGRGADPDDGWVGLTEVEGFPTFRCPADSALARSARLGAGAVLVVRTSAAGPPGMRVRVSGSLVVAAIEHRSPVAVVEVRLVPLRVSVHAGESDTEGVVVPLTTYDRVEAPTADFGTVAADVVAHSREFHGADVRAPLARRLAVPVETIAAAELTSVDEHGALISWVDAEGGHVTEVTFAAPLSCPHRLADALREALEA